MPVALAVEAVNPVLAMMDRIRGLDDCEFLRNLVAYHAAPVISGYKPAALISLHGWGRDYTSALRKSAKPVADTLGVKLCCVKSDQDSLTLLVYSPQLLEDTLSSPEAGKLLEEKGYFDAGRTLTALLSCLRLKSRDGAIPHEIGLFLGYPARDVRCFIEEGAESCKVTGCWKAYGNVEEAERCSNLWKETRAFAARLIASGLGLGDVVMELQGKRQLAA